MDVGETHKISLLSFESMHLKHPIVHSVER